LNDEAKVFLGKAADYLQIENSENKCHT